MYANLINTFNLTGNESEFYSGEYNIHGLQFPVFVYVIFIPTIASRFYIEKNNVSITLSYFYAYLISISGFN